MIAEADLIVGVVEAAVVGNEFGLAVALESRARHDVEDSIGAVAVFGIVAAALNFEVIDVFGIELRADVRSDVGVGHGHAIEQP